MVEIIAGNISHLFAKAGQPYKLVRDEKASCWQTPNLVKAVRVAGSKGVGCNFAITAGGEVFHISPY